MIRTVVRFVAIMITMAALVVLPHLAVAGIALAVGL